MSGRREVKYIPDSFQLVAGGVKEPQHIGLTRVEYLLHRAARLKIWQAGAIGAGVLIAVGLAVKSWLG